ncbi:MAG TPA: menaquinol oxidoreductase [Desulfuromonadaceae bacterium]
MTDISQEQQSVTEVSQERDGREALLQVIHKEIRRLRSFSNRGLWAFSLFLLVSMMAWYDFRLIPFPESFIASLGAPPPPHLISYLLLFYTFSAIILSLSRMTGNIEHKSSFCHVGYLTGFYLFYHFSKALDDNYWAVFGAGITILGVETYRIWNFCNEAIRIKNEQLEYVKKTGRMPIEDPSPFE